MLTPAPAPWIVRGATFALWALAAGSAAYWGLKLSSPNRLVAAPVAAPRQVGPVDPLALARLLGSSPAAAAAPAPVAALASRFHLLGVAAGASSGGGAAVISVDGKPPRSFRVGSPVDEGLVLQSVRGRQAVIASSDGTPVATLEVPLPRMDTSSRPAPIGAAPIAPPPVVPQPVVPPPAAAVPAPQAQQLAPRLPGQPITPPQPAGEPAQAPSEAPR